MLRNAGVEAVTIPTMVGMSVQEGDEIAECSSNGGDDPAGYLFELLVAARRLAVTRRHRFLAYLIGMAAEEARLLTQGRSAFGR